MFNPPDRKNRTPKEVTASLLTERLSTAQLLELIDNEKFGDFQPQILEKLTVVNRLRVNNFNKVHKSANGCDIQEIDTGQVIHFRGISEYGSIGQDVSAKRLHCSKHNVSTIRYCDVWGQRYEEPF